MIWCQSKCRSAFLTIFQIWPVCQEGTWRHWWSWVPIDNVNVSAKFARAHLVKDRGEVNRQVRDTTWSVVCCMKSDVLDVFIHDGQTAFCLATGCWHWTEIITCRVLTRGHNPLGCCSFVNDRVTHNLLIIHQPFCLGWMKLHSFRSVYLLPSLTHKHTNTHCTKQSIHFTQQQVGSTLKRCSFCPTKFKFFSPLGSILPDLAFEFNLCASDICTFFLRQH